MCFERYEVSQDIYCVGFKTGLMNVEIIKMKGRYWDILSNENLDNSNERDQLW